MYPRKLFIKGKNELHLYLIEKRNKFSNFYFAYSRLSAGKVNEKLDLESKKLWASRRVVERVILIDWNSKENDATGNAVIWHLRDILLMVWQIFLSWFISMYVINFNPLSVQFSGIQM